MLSSESVTTVASIGEAIIKVLTPVIMALGSIAMAQLTAWIKTKTRNTTVTGAMKILQDVVLATVQELEQTTVKALRDNGGKLNEESAMAIKASAIQKIKMLYGPEGMRDLAKRLGVSDDSVLRLIGSLIEQAVFALKGTPPNLPGPATDAPFDPNVFGGMTAEEKVDQQLREQAAKVAAATPSAP